ncbi:hypothetical protein BaRGS_00000209, partial [Batillaria attramentaria]
MLWPKAKVGSPETCAPCSTSTVFDAPWLTGWPSRGRCRQCNIIGIELGASINDSLNAEISPATACRSE